MEKSIPYLILPNLEDTLNKFPLKVNQNDKEYLKILHSKLEYLVKHNENWLEDLWIKSYLDNRTSLSTNVNPIFMFDLNTKDLSQNTIASNVVYWSLEFYKKIKMGTLEQEYIKSKFGATPLCMKQYESLFGSARIPHYNTDEIVTFTNSKHIIILRNGYFYSLKVLDDNYDIMSKNEIYHNLEKICKNKKINNHDISLMTASDRNDWASYRYKLNSKTLQIIDKALFVLCLDSHSSKYNLNDLVKEFLHPPNRVHNSRWYDKLQIIICSHGSTALNLEHTLCDGHILINYMNYVCKNTNFKVTNSYDNINNYKSKDFKSSFKILKWDIKDDLQIVNKLTNQIDIKVLNYTKFGSLFAKEHNMSPDGLFQMAYQLTYYKMFNKFANTYESVQMRKYKGGRTNNWRVVTDESIQLCQIFFKKIDNNDIKNALIEACGAHTKGIINCINGGGFDRHLFALKMLDIDNKVELFKDPEYYRLMNFNLSTSNSSGNGVKMFGFNPVVLHGYGFGIGYVINNNDACICITSNMKKSDEFVSILQVCLNKIYDLFIV